MNFRTEYSTRNFRNLALIVLCGAVGFILCVSAWGMNIPVLGKLLFFAGGLFSVVLGLYLAYEFYLGTRYDVEVVGTIVRWEILERRDAPKRETYRLDLEDVVEIVYAPFSDGGEYGTDEPEEFFAVDRLGKRRYPPIMGAKQQWRELFHYIAATFPRIKTTYLNTTLKRAQWSQFEDVVEIVHVPFDDGGEYGTDAPEDFCAVDRLGKRRALPLKGTKQQRRELFHYIATTFPRIKTTYLDTALKKAQWSQLEAPEIRSAESTSITQSR